MNHFDIKTHIYFGEKSLDRLSDIPYKKALIISDPYVVKSGMVHLVTSRLQQANIEFEIFDDVIPDPPIEKISLGVAAVLSSKADVLIAIGGGSAIDSAKAIREVASKADSSYPRPALIAIPTTSGTGSEVTSFSVISDTENHAKIPLADDSLLPDEAILDAELVKSVPPKITADTGMDVFTHALESYVSTSNNEFSAALAEKAIEITGSFLLRSYLDNNDTHARQKMHVASCLAGLAFNTASLGINHSMAHQLGATFHIPHGRANAMLLPHIIEYNSDINKYSRLKTDYPKHVRKYATVARTLGLQNFNIVTTIRALSNWCQFMMKEMDMPLSISETGVCTESEYFAQIPTMAKAALADKCTATNPRVPTIQEIEMIYTQLW
ncbi:MAG: iron-containing alcohol dehydrogenase [Ruminococcaceae bacterium]|nr:iron-containing alcohol dehydrogenase [Oscillospiraceae bacterium]